MKRLLLSLLGIVCISVGFVFVLDHEAAAPKNTAQHLIPAPNPVPSSTPAAFQKDLYSTTDPTSLWVIANKQHPLRPATYAPDDLTIPAITMRSGIGGDERLVRSSTASALEHMAAAAHEQGLTLTLLSGYRSYGLQTTLYTSYVKQDGQAAADRESARPGYSEHQTGLAADLGGTTNPSCNLASCFGTTPEGKWLAANGYLYGFIIRYPQDKEAVTGYMYEPWHVRYVGIALATEMHRTGTLSLEEFFNVTGGQNY
jgi:zinc D-Ala-D-Ala carboxypeptidase